MLLHTLHAPLAVSGRAPAATLLPGSGELLAAAATHRASFQAVELAYLGRVRVLKFNQWTGQYALWQYERGDSGQCDALSWPALASGRSRLLDGGACGLPC